MSSARGRSPDRWKARLGRTLVYGLVLSGELRSVKVGRARRVPAVAIDAFKAAKRRESDHVVAD